MELAEHVQLRQLWKLATLTFRAGSSVCESPIASAQRGGMPRDRRGPPGRYDRRFNLIFAYRRDTQKEVLKALTGNRRGYARQS